MRLFTNNGYSLPTILWGSAGKEGKRVSNKFINILSIENLCDMPLYIHILKHSRNKDKIIKYKR